MMDFGDARMQEVVVYEAAPGPRTAHRRADVSRAKPGRSEAVILTADWELDVVWHFSQLEHLRSVVINSVAGDSFFQW